MKQEAIKQAETKEMIIADVISRLQSLTKYDANICGGWVEHQAEIYGDWIKVEDIEALIKELQAKSR